MNEIINWFENAVISPINKVAIDKIIVKTEKKNVCCPYKFLIILIK